MKGRFLQVTTTTKQNGQPLSPKFISGFTKCSNEAKIYSTCIVTNLKTLQKDTCSKEMKNFMNCFKVILYKFMIRKLQKRNKSLDLTILNKPMKFLLLLFTFALSSKVKFITNPDTLNGTDYTNWCKDFTGQNIYNLGSKLDCPENSSTFSVAVCVAVFFTVILEFTINRIQKKMKNKVHKEILNKIYKELMMLGLISFFVNVLESSGLFELYFSAFKEGDEKLESDHTITTRRVIVFELVHISLFILSVFYVIICIVSFWICQRTWKRWSSYEITGEEEATKENIKLREQWNSLGWRKIYSWKLISKLWDSYDQISYFHSRTRFIFVNKLENNFRFDLYLRHQLQSLFMLLIEISWKLWIGILGISLMNWIRINYTFTSSSQNRLLNGGQIWIFILGFGYGILVISTLIFLFIQTSFLVYQRRITKKNSYLKVNDIEIKESLLTSSEKVVSLNESNESKPYFDVKNHHCIRSPYFTFTCLQLCLLAQSLYLALLCVHYSYVIINETQITNSLTLRICILIFSYLPSFFVTFISFPLALSPFCILSCVENKSNLQTVKLMKRHEEHQKNIQKKIHSDDRELVEDNDMHSNKDSDLFSSSSDSEVEIFEDDDLLKLKHK